MRMRKQSFLVVFILLSSCLAFNSQARAEGVSVGVSVAGGQQKSQAYDLYAQYTFSPWYSGDYAELAPFVSGGVSLWDRADKSIWGGNLNLGLKFSFGNWESWRPFLAVSVGGAYLSAHDFGALELGSKGQFRERGSLGVEFGEVLQHEIMLDVTHYSNANLNAENDGYTSFGGSYAYTF